MSFHDVMYRIIQLLNMCQKTILLIVSICHVIYLSDDRDLKMTRKRR